MTRLRSLQHLHVRGARHPRVQRVRRRNARNPARVKRFPKRRRPANDRKSLPPNLKKLPNAMAMPRRALVTLTRGLSLRHEEVDVVVDARVKGSKLRQYQPKRRSLVQTVLTTIMTIVNASKLERRLPTPRLQLHKVNINNVLSSGIAISFNVFEADSRDANDISRQSSIY